ncbi:MAG: MarR family transcriptional regulator [Calditrichaceae bacterium]|jgi:DNA-binding MarR family transcriptional regulator
MELEKEIQQNHFKSDYHKMIVNLLYTGNWVQNKVAARLKPYDLTPQQFNILRILRGQHPNPATVHLLQERMLDNMSNASRLVERLRQKGLIRRKICKNDRRAVDVLITDAGLDLLEELDKTENEWLSSFKIIKSEEVQHLNKILDRLRG